MVGITSASPLCAVRTWLWLGMYTNKLRPITNNTAAMIRKTIGALSNHTFISTGAGLESYLSSETGMSTNTMNRDDSYIDDFLRVIPNRLLIA